MVKIVKFKSKQGYSCIALSVKGVIVTFDRLTILKVSDLPMSFLDDMKFGDEYIIE